MSGLERDPSPADRAWQQRTNRREAQARLIQLRRAEPLASRIQELPAREDLPAERIAQLGHLLRQSYRDATQSEPEWHGLFRLKLEQAALTGDRTVDQILSEIRRTLENAQPEGPVKGEG